MLCFLELPGRQEKSAKIAFKDTKLKKYELKKFSIMESMMTNPPERPEIVSID